MIYTHTKRYWLLHRLCLLCVAMESEDGPQSKTLANEVSNGHLELLYLPSLQFSELMSGDLYVTALVTRGYILAGELPQAREVCMHYTYNYVVLCI